jgi:hypothetical protein
MVDSHTFGMVDGVMNLWDPAAGEEEGKTGPNQAKPKKLVS